MPPHSRPDRYRRRDQARAEEARVAGAVEIVFAQHLAQPLGHRTRRDARDASGLRVDFTYDANDPPVALETTSIPDSAWQAARAAARKHLSAPLTTVAEREQLGRWCLEIAASARVKPLGRLVLPVLRSGNTFTPGDYSSDDLILAERLGRLDEFVRQHDQLASAGIARISRLGDHPHSVDVATWTVGGLIAGFGAVLSAAAEDNAAKLAETRPRTTVLAVSVSDFAVSQYPHLTAVPDLPSTIDHLVVLHRQRGPEVVWYTARGDAAWTLQSAGRTANT